MVTIVPGIFDNDEKEIVRKLDLVCPYVTTVQIDVADGSLVSAHTATDFSFLKKTHSGKPLSNIILEAHLMVSKPETYIKNLITSGFTRLIAHIECQDPREFLSEAQMFACEIGFAVDLETPLEEVEPFLEEIDVVLIMSAVAGASGQGFDESAVSKIRTLHRTLPDMPIEVDCGINEETIKLACDAGATRFVTTSYIFKDESRIGEAIQKLRSSLLFRD